MLKPGAYVHRAETSDSTVSSIYITGVRTRVQKVTPKMAELTFSTSPILLFLSARSNTTSGQKFRVFTSM